MILRYLLSPKILFFYLKNRFKYSSTTGSKKPWYKFWQCIGSLLSGNSNFWIAGSNDRSSLRIYDYTGALPLHLLQLTQNLYTWLKTVSLFYLPRKAQASQDIVCSRNLDSPNQPSAKENQFTFAPIPKKIRLIYLILNQALKPVTSVLLASTIWKTSTLLA